MLPYIHVTKRSVLGSGGSKQSRRNGLIPAVIYGNDKNHIYVDDDDISTIIRKNGDNALVELDIEGKKLPAHIKEVQRHPISGSLLHIDFKPLNADRNITAKVPVKFVNTEDMLRKGGVIQTQKNDIEISCPISIFPRSITIDAGKYGPGNVLKIKDLEISEELSVIDNKEDIVAVITYGK